MNSRTEHSMTLGPLYPAGTVVLLGQESDGGGSHAARGSPAGTLSWAARAALMP